MVCHWNTHYGFFQKVGWSSRSGCCRIFSTSSINNSTVSSLSELMLFYFELVFVNFNSNDTTNIWCFLFMTLNITIVTTSGEIHDEWTLAENVPQPDYRTRMSRHWNEWISRKPSSYLFHHPSSILFIYEYFSPPCLSIVKKCFIIHRFNFVFSGKSWRPCQTLASITSASRLVIGLGRWIQASLSLTRSSTTPIPWELSSTSRGCLSGSTSWG